MDYDAIGRWLLEHREALGLTQKDVAARMGRHALTVRRMERGEPMKLNTLVEYLEIIEESPFTAILVGLPRDRSLVLLRKTLDSLSPGERGLLLGKSGEMASRLLAMEAERGFLLEGEQLYDRLRLLYTEAIGVLDSVERITSVFSESSGSDRLLSDVTEHLRSAAVSSAVDGYGEDGLNGLQELELPDTFLTSEVVTPKYTLPADADAGAGKRPSVRAPEPPGEDSNS